MKSSSGEDKPKKGPWDLTYGPKSQEEIEILDECLKGKTFIYVGTAPQKKRSVEATMKRTTRKGGV